MATKTLVTAFSDARLAERAVYELHEAGFARDDLGWISQSRDGNPEDGRVGKAAAGGALGGLAGLLVGVAALAVPGIGALVVAGPLLSTLAGASIGAAAGTIVDALIRVGVPSDDAADHAVQLRAGGAIVTVTVDDDEEEERARAILRSHAPRSEPPTLHWRAPAYTDEGRPSLQSLV